MTAKNRLPRSLGVVDIGSNSVRLETFDMTATPPRSFFNGKVMCHLGKEIARTGRLWPKGKERAWHTLAGFKHLTTALEIEKLVVVGTAAIRDAEDGTSFVREIKNSLHLNIEVLDGEEEAVLAGYGVLFEYPKAEGLIADLGGGSLDVAYIGEGKVDCGISFQLGVLRLMEREGDVKPYIYEQLKSLADRPVETLYVVGGSWREISKVWNLDVSDGEYIKKGEPFAVEMLRPLVLKLEGEDPEVLIRDFGADRKRAPTLPYAACLMECLIDVTGAKNIVFSLAGLREGLVQRELKSC